MDQRPFNAQVFRRGNKAELFADAQPDAERDDAAELQQKLGDLHDLWSAPRIGRDLSAAMWKPELGVAEVLLQKGKLFHHMGYTQGSKLYLHIEEAVYLVDRANLLLFIEARGTREERRLLSLQEAYDLMVGCGVTAERYLVYCKLARAGYILQRHPARWNLRLSESPRQVWQRWYPAQQQQSAEGGGGQAKQAGQPAAAATARQQPAGSRPPTRGPVGGAAAKKRKLKQAKCGSWWQGGPGGLPWLRGLPADFEEGLPRCEVAADRRGRWAQEYPAMAPLRALPDAELAQERRGDDNLLDYDVYEPNSKFARLRAGPPAFRVAVLPARPAPGAGWFPGLEALAAADRASPGIPVKLATVEMGDIAFYGVGRAELHCIL